MKPQYFPPTFHATEFHCIHCGVFASQSWLIMYVHEYNNALNVGFAASRCAHCKDLAFWYEGKMIVPTSAPVEPAHGDLPETCRGEFDEARNIFSQSPRAAAALLRLCIQKLMPHLGESGTNINDDIKSLVAKGLPSTVQRALDFCRVVGNHAVHPGEITLNDSPEIAQQLFRMINFIVDDRITRPREIEELYQTLPEGNRKAIEERDQPKRAT
jgi:hypothetical protein